MTAALVMDVPDLFGQAGVTRSRAEADVDVELEEQLRRLCTDRAIRKTARYCAWSFYANLEAPTRGDLEQLIDYLERVRRQPPRS